MHSTNIGAVKRRRHVATQLNIDAASEYDFVIVLDASGSMGYPSTRFAGKTRWEEAQETIYGLASALNKYDSDGIDIVVFGADIDTFEGVTPEKVLDIFKTKSPRGSTPLAEALEAVVALNGDGKKAVAIVFTDGAPDDGPKAAEVIRKAAESQEKDEDFTILFVQIGDDAGATKYLNFLDDELNAKFDIVDTIKAGEADKFEPIDLINKAIND
jgi:hypothetical protein